MLKPNLPLPDFLRGNETGTFTEDSVVRRLPRIAHQAIEDNDLDGHYRDQVVRLAAEVGEGVVSQIDEPESNDRLDWQRYVRGYEGMRWVDTPWFFIETYFYRRLMAATGYSQPGPRCGVDPFSRQKEIALDSALSLAAALHDHLDNLPALLAASLWANRADLSLWRADEVDADLRTAEVLNDWGSRLLVDDTELVAEILDRDGVNIHIVLDNSGTELVADLALAAAVVRRGGRVTLHAKPHPTFVSDVTIPDLEATIARLNSEATAAADLASELLEAQDTGALQAKVHPFWVSPLPFWDCPEDLVDELAAADLVIVKGDANYRRLLGERHWDPTTPFHEIVRPLQPLVALRTNKALVAAGIAPGKVENARTIDPDWLVNGEWGVIQFAPEVG